ncbi:MAG: C-terminal binding protein [Actinomycetia bacterium]|nr:C-terminal binding protein [Actinomycetes bacterium]
MADKKKIVAPLPAMLRPGVVDDRYGRQLSILGDLAEVHEVQVTSPEALIEGARDADALMTTWGVRITREIIAELDQCVTIGLASVGVDMVDVEAATDHGIVVTNAPDAFIEEVADHAMLLLLSGWRRFRRIDEMARTDGDWHKSRPLLNNYRPLRGQTLGLVAFGNVATLVARRAKAFGLNVIAHDPYVSSLRMVAEDVESVLTLDELLERSDFVSMHSALNEETHHLIGAEQLARMKDTAILINTSRGGTVDGTAVAEAIARGSIAGAALDVLEEEPPDLSHPLFALDDVIITSHVASASSMMRVASETRAAREIALVLKGRWPMACVNPTVLPKIELERWQPVSMDRGPNR